MEHGEVYRLPEVYEIAFSYRDTKGECDFLTAVYEMAAGRPPASVLEMACGPAVHAREFARRGLGVAALDLSQEMVEYARARLGPGARVVVADMADFVLEPPVDLAFTLIDSLPYLTTNDQFLSHFLSVRRALNPGGVYVIELRHPREAHPRASTLSHWTMQRGAVRVTTDWASTMEHDPVAQTSRVLSRMTVEGDGEPQVIESWGLLRPLFPQELLALVGWAGGWRLVGWWGDFDLGRPLGESVHDWRMIVGLQKV